MIKLGYTKEEVLKITKFLPSIYSYNILTIITKIEEIMLLGYTKEETLTLTKTLPTIFSITIENMQQKINYLIELGYTKEEVIAMSKILPAIYTYTNENIKNKKEFYESIGVSDFILYDTRQLMQSIDLSYARYKYYQKNDIDITIDNYRLLFISEERFFKRYNYTKNQLLKKYNYEKDKEKSKYVRTI